jgi:hypothetical protein
MAGPAKVNIRDTCKAIPFCITMAESAIQIGRLFMADMIKENGLIDRNPGKNRKEGEEGSLYLNRKAVANGKIDHQEGDEDQDRDRDCRNEEKDVLNDFV